MNNKIRCTECGNVIAMEIKPFPGDGAITIMCNNKKPNGKRCKTINLIGNIDPQGEFSTTINQKLI